MLFAAGFNDSYLNKGCGSITLSPCFVYMKIVFAIHATADLSRYYSFCYIPDTNKLVLGSLLIGLLASALLQNSDIPWSLF